VPRHKAGPPETVTDLEFANLLRVPERRARHGKRDLALLRVLGDCGLRAGELRGLQAGDLRRPRSNARHFRLFVRGKGGTEREVHVPQATQDAPDSRLAVHPLARYGRLRDDEPLFVRLGRHHGSELPEALSTRAVYKIVRAAALAAGIPDRLAHPHALRSYWRPACSKTASPCTSSKTASGTPTCAPPAATPSCGRSTATRPFFVHVRTDHGSPLTPLNANWRLNETFA